MSAQLAAIYYLLGAVGLLSAQRVIGATNPVHRIANLVLLFLVGAFLYLWLEFYFLGLTYIIVYCGAIAILFLFVIMMISEVPTSRGWIVLPAFGQFFSVSPNLNAVNYYLPNWTLEFTATFTDIHTLATMVYQSYPTAQILIGVTLWVVMIGVIQLTVSE